METSVTKHRVVVALEQGLNTTISDIRRVNSSDNLQFYVMTEQGLMLCTYNRGVVTYKHSLIDSQGSVKVPKQAEKIKPKQVVIKKEGRKYYAKELIEKPASFLLNAPEAELVAWRHAVYVATNGKKTKSTYAKAVIIYNTNKKAKDEQTGDIQ